MIVYLLTEEQKVLLEGREFAKDSFFKPIDDANGNWVITEEEVSIASCEDILWVKDLPQIEYKAKEIFDLKVE